jgi:hypothetical protein
MAFDEIQKVSVRFDLSGYKEIYVQSLQTVLVSQITGKDLPSHPRLQLYLLLLDEVTEEALRKRIMQKIVPLAKMYAPLMSDMSLVTRVIEILAEMGEREQIRDILSVVNKVSALDISIVQKEKILSQWALYCLSSPHCATQDALSVLQKVQQINPFQTVQILQQVRQKLAPDDCSQIFEWIRQQDDPLHRARLLAPILSVLPPAEQRQETRYFLSLQDPYVKVCGLLRLFSGLPRQESFSLAQSVISSAQKIENSRERLQVYTKLLPWLDVHSRTALIEEIFEMSEHERMNLPVFVWIRMAPYLGNSHERWRKAIDLMLRSVPPPYRRSVWLAFLTHMPSDLRVAILPKALQDSCNYIWEDTSGLRADHYKSIADMLGVVMRFFQGISSDQQGVLIKGLLDTCRQTGDSVAGWWLLQMLTPHLLRASSSESQLSLLQAVLGFDCSFFV